MREIAELFDIKYQKLDQLKINSEKIRKNNQNTKYLENLLENFKILKKKLSIRKNLVCEYQKLADSEQNVDSLLQNINV